MNILFVTPRLPLPADTGAKIRAYNLLKCAAADNCVSLLSFYFEEDDNAIEKLKQLGIVMHLVKAKENLNLFSIFSKKPISIEKYRSKHMQERLKYLTINKNFDLVHFDHLHMGQYSDYTNGKPCIIDDHNVESILLDRCATISKNIVKKQLFKSQSRKMASFEPELVNKVSKCLVVSDEDKKSLSDLAGQDDNIEVIPNGVDTEYFRSPSHRVTVSPVEEVLVFTGSMDWLPNIDAVEYFCKDILPLIWEEEPDVKFYVIGKNPPKNIIEFGKKDKRIVVTEKVQDVRPYIEKAKVFVAPIRIGGGTRLKILEAMAMEKPVVSTTVGAEGIAYKPGENIILKDNPKEFAEAINILLKDKDKRDCIGKSARNLVCKDYDWNIIGKKLQGIYRGLTYVTYK